MAGFRHNTARRTRTSFVRTHRPASRDAGAIVVGGGHVGLALARSLGRHGIEVWCVLEPDPIPALPALSRYCRRTVKFSGSTPRAAADFLLHLAESTPLDGWTLYPTSDETAKVVALYHDELSARYLLTVSPWENFRFAYDKRCTYRIAQEIGVDVPPTYCPPNATYIGDLPSSFPVVLKPAIKETENAFTAGKAWRVDDAEQLRQRYAEAAGLVPRDTILVQDFVAAERGGQLSFAGVCLDGELYASVTARRLRQHPDDFGVATYVKTVDEPSVVVEARKVIAAMHLTGFVEMDFVRDIKTRRLYLLDVNPRPWSWHGIGRRANVDFPYLMWRLLHGDDIAPTVGHSGAAWLHLIPDLQCALERARQHRLDLRDYARTLFARKAGAVFALDDPLPGVMEPLLLLARRRRASGPELDK